MNIFARSGLFGVAKWLQLSVWLKCGPLAGRAQCGWRGEGLSNQCCYLLIWTYTKMKTLWNFENYSDLLVHIKKKKKITGYLCFIVINNYDIKEMLCFHKKEMWIFFYNGGNFLNWFKEFKKEKNVPMCFVF